MELAGGARRAAEAPALAAWRILRRSRQGELGPVVAACSRCSQPMVAPVGSALPAVEEWRLSTPAGDLVLGERLVLPDGTEVGPEAAERWLERELHEGLAWDQLPGAVLRGMSCSLVALLIGTVWIMAALFVTGFLWSFAQGGPG